MDNKPILQHGNFTTFTGTPIKNKVEVKKTYEIISFTCSDDNGNEGYIEVYINYRDKLHSIDSDLVKDTLICNKSHEISKLKLKALTKALKYIENALK